jgi:hypothetical protein
LGGGGGQPSKLIAIFAIFTLSFFSLTAITLPTQNAQAATSPLCGANLGTGSEPFTATTVTYDNKKFDIIGFNNNGNKVGSAGPNNSVTLLLNKDESTGVSFLAANPDYDASAIKTKSDEYFDTMIDTSGIIARTLTGGSSYIDQGSFLDDNVRGNNISNQKVWTLSDDEVSHLVISERTFTNGYWLRSPGNSSYRHALVLANGTIATIGSNSAYFLRLGLYLDINSPSFAGLTFDSALPIGACIAEPHNPIGINFVAETVTGFDTDVEGWSFSDSFAGLSTPAQLTSTSLDVSANISSTSSTLFYNKATTSTDHFDSYYNNDKQPTESLAKLVIPARPSAPSGLAGAAPTDLGASDGKITGTSNKMEYSTDEVSWTAVGGSAITGLTSGTYFVRTIADQSTSKFKSFAIEVVVKEGSTGPGSGPSAGKPGSGTGPSAVDGGFSSEGTAQTGIDFTGLELLALLILAFSVIAKTGIWNYTT